MIPAGGIQDQQLTIIVLMMLIELALLRLSRAAFFKHLLLLGHMQKSKTSCRPVESYQF
jgi:hypothetical protein